MAVADTILSIISTITQPLYLVLIFIILFVLVIIHFMSKQGF